MKRKQTAAYYVSYMMPVASAIRKLELVEAHDAYVVAREVHPKNGKAAMLRIPRELAGRQQVFDMFHEARLALLNYHEGERRAAHTQLITATQNIAAAQQLEAV